MVSQIECAPLLPSRIPVGIPDWLSRQVPILLHRPITLPTRRAVRLPGWLLLRPSLQFATYRSRIDVRHQRLDATLPRRSEPLNERGGGLSRAVLRRGAHRTATAWRAPRRVCFACARTMFRHTVGPDSDRLGDAASARRFASRRTGYIATHVIAPQKTAPNVRMKSHEYQMRPDTNMPNVEEIRAKRAQENKN
jgi:hypothetical protein